LIYLNENCQHARQVHFAVRVEETLHKKEMAAFLMGRQEE
jgi:hypothetical protein